MTRYNQMNALFRERIGIPENENITFETLHWVLEKTPENIPFENLCILENRTDTLTKENLIKKILVRNEGGLCYELSMILYFFLLENGFDVALARAVMYNHALQKYQVALGRTHVIILITHKEQMYLIDTGYGGNLPLQPVPLTGETVTSRNGEFRVKKINSDHGNYVFEMKLKHKDTDWKTGYAFDSNKLIKDLSELDEVQRIIVEHKESPFNKSPIITQLTTKGNLTLTKDSFTQWIDGVVSKEEIDDIRYKELLKQHFGL